MTLAEQLVWVVIVILCTIIAFLIGDYFRTTLRRADKRIQEAGLAYYYLPDPRPTYPDKPETLTVDIGDPLGLGGGTTTMNVPLEYIRIYLGRTKI